MKVLVAGGAGYIGSHAVRELLKIEEYQVVVFDNLSSGHVAAVPENVPFVKGDIRNKDDLNTAFENHNPDAVMHFCASISVPESCADPLKYYDNNVCGTVLLLQTMQAFNVKYFIFSSTAAVFGYPEKIPIDAEDRCQPINPYGDTKLVVEHMLKWCDAAFGLKYICLRYFNASGADEKGDIGEDHCPETHLIPLVLQVAQGKRDKIFVFGDDYNTRDGTCIRDYIHVTDLASAHEKALQHIVQGNDSNYFNLGSGEGFSVKEIIDAARTVTKHPIPIEIKPRRAGDPDCLVASSKKAETTLKWERKYNTIEDIVASAWKFHLNFADGYSKNES